MIEINNERNLNQKVKKIFKLYPFVTSLNFPKKLEQLE